MRCLVAAISLVVLCFRFSFGGTNDFVVIGNNLPSSKVTKTPQHEANAKSSAASHSEQYVKTADADDSYDERGYVVKNAWKEDGDEGDKSVYTGQEVKNYNAIKQEGGVNYVNKPEQGALGNDIGINVDNFISDFLLNAKNNGLDYSLLNRPRRQSGADNDGAVFCMDRKSLCFTVVWQKGRDNLLRVAMIAAGDGTQHSGRDVFNAVHAFIATITPGLTKEHRQNLMKSMGITTSEMGSGSIVKPDGKRIIYELARSSRVGLVVIASSVNGSLRCVF